MSTSTETTKNEEMLQGLTLSPEAVTFLEKAAKAEQAYHAERATKTTDSCNPFTEVLQDIDFETLTRVSGADYEETVRHLAEQGYTALSWRNYHRNYQADVSKEVDSRITMICHMNADTKMAPSAATLSEYGTRLTHEPHGFIRRAGQMVALQALIETPKVCRGLAARLQKELARYEPELWQAIGMEGPPA